MNDVSLRPGLEGLDSDVVSVLREARPIEVLGLGSITTHTYGAYEGRDPRTGAVINVPAARTFSLTPPAGLVIEHASWRVWRDMGLVVECIRPDRIGRNPQTAELVRIPKKGVRSFQPSSALIAAVEGITAPPVASTRALETVLRAIPPDERSTLHALTGTTSATLASLFDQPPGATFGPFASWSVEPYQDHHDEKLGELRALWTHGTTQWSFFRAADSWRVVNFQCSGRFRCCHFCRAWQRSCSRGLS